MIDHADSHDAGTPTAEPPARQETGDAEAVLAVLRAEPTNPHLLRGYGPLAAAAIVLLLMVLLLPSVAREREVERPVDDPVPEASP